MSSGEQSKQFTTFYLGDRVYGIDVMQVQEVTNPMTATLIRLAKPYIKGLINLRGQLATAIGLRELFCLDRGSSTEHMTVVCRADGMLLSLLVDRIGEVIEVDSSRFEPPPDTIQAEIRKFMTGVYKTDGQILSVIGIDKILNEISQIAS